MSCQLEQTIANTVCGHHPWSPYIDEKSCHFNERVIAFTMTLLEALLSTVSHIPWNISWYFLLKSGSKMTCIANVNGDYSDLRDVLKLHMCSYDVLEDAHQGALKQTSYPVQELGRKAGGGHIFEGGVLAGDYGMLDILVVPSTGHAQYSSVYYSVVNRNLLAFP